MIVHTTGLKVFAVALGVLSAFGAQLASASPRPADTPPAFRIYDVDRREREMRNLIAHLAGTSVLSRPRADAALARLDDIHARERDARRGDGGHLSIGATRSVDAQLNTLARNLNLRESRR